MKKHYFIKFIAITGCLLWSQIASAQLVNCNVFLKGLSIEVGINTNGAYGSSVPAPVGFHPKGGAGTANTCPTTTSACPAAGTNLGFVADPDKDGWTVGTPPYFGDYFLPGDPQEGWAVQLEGKVVKAYNGSGYDACGGTPVPYSPASAGMTGKNISYYTTGNKHVGVWQGTLDSVLITQTTIMDTEKVFFTTFISMVNTGKVAKKNAFYLRTVDPDNDEPEPGGGFVTRNKIEYQLPNELNRTMVSATGESSSKAFLGLGTLDCRARCFIIHGSLSPDWGNLDTMYGTAEGYIDSTHYQYNDSDTNDEGIGLVFKLGDIPAQDSLTFAYAYVLRIGDLDSAFESTRPKWKSATDSNTHISGDTIIVCAQSSVKLSVVNGTGLRWKWDSPTGNALSDTSGLTTNIKVDTGLVIARAIGTSASCIADSEIIYLRSFTPPPPLLSNNGPLCLGEKLQLYSVKLSTAFTDMVWHGPNNFTSTLDNPVINNVKAIDSGVYYVVDSAPGCPAQIAKTRVIIDPVVASILPSRPGACVGAPMDFYFNGVANDSGTSYRWTFDNGVQLSGDPADTSKGPYTIRWDSVSNRIVTLRVQNWRCVSTTSVNIPVISAPQVHFDMPKDICLNDTILAAVADYSLPNAEGFAWSFGSGGNFDTTGTSFSLGRVYGYYNSIGVKVVKLTINYTTCTQNPFYDTVTVHSLPDAKITGTGQTQICLGDTVTFNADYGDKYRYIWSPTKDYVGQSGNAINSGRMIIPFTGNVYLTVRDQYNCHAIDSMYINPDRCCDVELPSAFSPNGDGRNDLFRPITIGHHKLKIFRVVNRYGQTVYESNVESNGWDGRFGGVPQDMGTYFYYLNYDCNGKTIEKKGDVTLIR